ncbi:protein Lines homolog 1 [Talpa occidentalis]|uniref:protein Lines homolog 1 n=1 Tax=Talpa occidentalis TaxID=50954 RepID=UPI0018902390|nr:protein Lines homolog 1 [Talpa occidentalis]XP_037365969.1 protein Lines homolog 1 [Talpa occidentalis]XP_037365970.1 protein Lines homolog 1 [Talpa occidentalis]XP_037365971.1 protein Lines homolog 1 [Talpa occidentalis]XP_037365972.1 protein Lines homolog 1 [Talpa occidentalis]
MMAIKTEACFEILGQLYEKVLLGTTLENDSHDCGCYLSPAFSDQASSSTTCSEGSDNRGVPDGRPPASTNSASTNSAEPKCWKRNAQQSSAWEIRLLQLTVIRVMITRILSSDTELQAKEKYREIIKILLKSSEVDSELTSMFQNSDKLLPHMAAKCLALLVYFRLKEKMTLSKSWIAFCQKNLSVHTESDKVVYCLSTLTDVIKETFKDPCSQKTEILKQFLTPFDTVFEEFYNSFFSQHFENFQDTSKIVTSLMSFLELLELLIATRIHLKSHFTCQRLLFLKPSCVLNVITWPIKAFVKRKCIIFIKKCLLQKVGEDLCRGSVPALTLPDPHFDTDMLALADAILQAVDLGLLRALSVCGEPSCFGGDEVQPGGAHVPGADHVTLRAASLLIIKSLEIKFQSCASVNEMKVDLQRFMSELLTFLKPHLRPCLPSCNLCEWLPKVFIEQDDDMLEAAKALMAIYLKLTRDCETTESLTQEKEMWKHHTHDNGYNPHCIFLFFLRNIGFDSSVLLDFLISSETCFLEYFVRYLKLLQKEWDNFFTICKYFDVTELKDNIDICGCAPFLVEDRNSNQAEPGPLAAAGSQRNNPSWHSPASPEPLRQVVMSKETQGTLQDDRRSPQKVSQSLVDYDSSEDSEVESTDQHIANSKWTSVYQEAKKNVQDTCGKGRNEKGLNLEPHSRPLFPNESNAPVSVLCDIATNSIFSEGGVSYSTARCFEELQGAIQRLQKKNLFPYNPTALLKLLKHIEAIYNKCVSPL